MVNGTYLLGDEMGVDSSDVSRANKKQVEQLMMAGLHVQVSSYLVLLGIRWMHKQVR